MKNDKETFNEIMSYFESMVCREKVYVEVDGNWLEIQFERYFVCINLWSGVISVWDTEKSKEIYREN